MKYLLFLAFQFIVSAYAAISPTVSYGPFTNPQYGGSYSSASAACNVYQQQQGHLGVTVTIELQSRTATEEVWKCNVLNPTVGNGYVMIGGASSGSSCPANSTLSGGACSCNSGFSENAGSCTATQTNNCPPAGTSAGRWGVPYVVSNGASGTYNVCDAQTPANSSGDVCGVSVVGETATGSPMMVYGKATFTGKKYALSQCTGTGAGSGSTDTPASGNTPNAPAGEAAPTPCPTGYAPGTVNGVTKCYPTGSHPDPVTTETKTETKAPSVDGNAPTVTSTSKTVCDQLNCTTQTTTTTTKADGTSSTASGIQTTTKEGFCTANPKSAQCSGTGGSTGDCNGNTTVGCAELGTPTDQTLPSADSGFSSITPATFQGSAGCPAPQTFQVLSRSYAVSFQPMCDGSANYIKPVVLVLAAAAAAWIFIGGFKV